MHRWPLSFPLFLALSVAAPAAWAQSDDDVGSGGESGFMDVRLNLTLTNENLFAKPGETIPSVPGWRFGRPNSLGTLFFDNYDTRFSGYETLSHAVLYRRVARQNWEVEGALVLRINDVAQSKIDLSDAGSYVRVAYWLDPARKVPDRVSIVAFPTSSDRMRLGYSYRLSWGGSDEYRRSKTSVPGIKVQYDRGDMYAYVGAKSAVVLDRETAEEEAVLAGLMGAGVDITPNVRVELNGGYFDRGSNELQDVLSETVQLYGVSAQVAVHDGMPVGSSIDYALYRNDPERVGRLFRKTEYPGGLSWLAKAEATLLGQTLKDPEATGSTTVQYGTAADLNARVKLNRTRLRLDAQVRKPGLHSPFDAIVAHVQRFPDGVRPDAQLLRGPRRRPKLLRSVDRRRDLGARHAGDPDHAHRRDPRRHRPRRRRIDGHHSLAGRHHHSARGGIGAAADRGQVYRPPGFRRVFCRAPRRLLQLRPQSDPTPTRWARRSPGARVRRVQSTRDQSHAPGKVLSRFLTVFVVTVSIAGAVAVPACKRSRDDASRQVMPVSQPAQARGGETARAAAEARDGDTTVPSDTDSEHWAFLYAVEKGSARNYLLGTIHVGFDYQELPGGVWDRLAASRRVVLEVDMRAAAADSVERALLPPGRTLAALLGAPDWTRLTALLEDYPPHSLDRLQPWAAVDLVLARVVPTVLPLELAVLRRAERRGKALVFLESVEQQLASLAAIDARFLAQLLDPNSAMRQRLADSIAAYRRGDFAALAAATADPAAYGGDLELRDTLLYRRNQRWLAKLVPELERGAVFAAVGAAHLVGERGLLAQLEGRGYRITRLPR